MSRSLKADRPKGRDDDLDLSRELVRDRRDGELRDKTLRKLCLRRRNEAETKYNNSFLEWWSECFV